MELKVHASILWKRKPTILLCTVISFQIGILINFKILPVVFGATSKVLIENPSPTEILAEGASGTAHFLNLDAEIRSKILRSPQVVKRAGEILGYSEKESFELLTYMTIYEIGPTGIIEFNYESSNPSECANIVNAYAKAFKETSEEVSDKIKINIFEEAAVPTVPIHPNRAKNMVVMTILGFFLGLGIAIFQEAIQQDETKKALETLKSKQINSSS